MCNDTGACMHRGCSIPEESDYNCVSLIHTHERKHTDDRQAFAITGMALVAAAD